MGKEGNAPLSSRNTPPTSLQPAMTDTNKRSASSAQAPSFLPLAPLLFATNSLSDDVDDDDNLPPFYTLFPYSLPLSTLSPPVLGTIPQDLQFYTKNDDLGWSLVAYVTSRTDKRTDVETNARSPGGAKTPPTAAYE